MATPQPVQHHSHQILDSQPFQTPITTEQHPHSVQQPSVFVLDSIREREGEVKEAESEDELKEGIRRDSKQVRAILKQRRRLEKMDEISDNSTHMSTSFSSISHFSSPTSKSIVPSSSIFLRHFQALLSSSLLFPRRPQNPITETRNSLFFRILSAPHPASSSESPDSLSDTSNDDSSSCDAK
ncbi:hypothetical protein BLNAU_12759 [Blattamonas nauphoetae]|uniref:Uncharacterized protein n=1 Tax=Blattamonas nauphoetae TaxID=2049346 RepID=A0ABQ9XLJ6_9EUKA|nr:hypothetical protein BLNAU_12759 [Blattamonas nauphoetae]